MSDIRLPQDNENETIIKNVFLNKPHGRPIIIILLVPLVISVTLLVYYRIHIAMYRASLSSPTGIMWFICEF